MSADLVREAAVTMRHDVEFAQYPTSEDAFLLAVADWLQVVAARYGALLDTFAPGSRAGAVTAAENVTDWPQALVVARAYLGRAA